MPPKKLKKPPKKKKAAAKKNPPKKLKKAPKKKHGGPRKGAGRPATGPDLSAVSKQIRCSGKEAEIIDRGLRSANFRREVDGLPTLSFSRWATRVLVETSEEL